MINKLIAYLQRLSNIHIILIIFVLGSLVYANSLNNEFIGDDFPQIYNNPSIQDVSNIPALFTQGTVYDDSGQRSGYYKPILSTTYALIYAIFGKTSFGYHLIQLLLHISNVIMIFLIFKYFFKQKLSFLLSLVFLIHPINTEAVVHISAMQDNLFLFFGLVALYLEIKQSDKLYAKILVPILLLFSLLSKETGALFLIIIPLVNYLYQKKRFFVQIIQLLSVSLLYIFLRFQVAHIYFDVLKVNPIATLSLEQRLISVPKIIFYYIETFIFPKNLIAFQHWTINYISFFDFYLPLFIDMTAFVALFFGGVYIYKKGYQNFKIFLFFAIWFLTSLTFHLQIFPLDQTVADRWFYLPMIGLLGVIGVILSQYNFRNRWSLNILAVVLVIIVTLFMGRVIMRNQNWSDTETLYSHDIQVNKNSYVLEIGLGDIAFKNGDITHAKAHYLNATKYFPSLNSYTSLGYFYLQVNNAKNAENAFTKAVSYNRNFAISWGYLAIAKYKAGDKNGAMIAAEKAYDISPTSTFLAILNAIKNNAQINFE